MLYRQVLVPKQSETPADTSSNQPMGVHRIKGMKFALTGRMNHTREYYKEFIEKYGGTVVDKVTRAVDAIFIGSNSRATSKYQDATRLQIPILLEHELRQLIVKEDKIRAKESSKQLAARNIRGKSFVLTGTLSEKRDLVIQKIASHGGSVSSKVARHTDYLIVGDKGTTTTKYKDALAYGIRIITESELRNMLN